MNRTEGIKKYYETRSRATGEDYEILGWESKEAHLSRFRVLIENVDCRNKKLLDVGCGVGSLLGYLNELKIPVEYSGIDILRDMIDSARLKYGNSLFYCGDMFKCKIFNDKYFDIVYTSGMFNLNLGNNHDFLKQALTEFFGISNDVVAFNLLHPRSPGKEPGYFYIHPDEVIKIINENYNDVKKIDIIDSYLGNDFTVICRIK